MKTRRKQKRRQEYEIYNHRIIWSSANAILLAVQDDETPSKRLTLGALALFFFALEGYLNWLGQAVAPEVWDQERSFFSRAPFQGALGKLHYLQTILHTDPLEKNARPFTTLEKLQELRHALAHPKREKGERMVDGELPEFMTRYRGRLDRLVSRAFAHEAKEDISRVAEDLHKAATRFYPNAMPNSLPFSGLMGFQRTEI